jgi:hypothetical protein
MNRGALPTAMTGLFGTIWADSSINPDAAKLGGSKPYMGTV